MKFAPEYGLRPHRPLRGLESVLPVAVMAIHYAHLVMLAATGVVSRVDAHRLREALTAAQRELKARSAQL